MSDNLPQRTDWPDELIRKIAMDVGAQVVAQIEHAHPEMCRAVISWKSTRVSIRNATHNALIASIKAAADGTIDDLMRSRAAHRRRMRALQRAAGERR